jgi:hypothetical protein
MNFTLTGLMLRYSSSNKMPAGKEIVPGEIRIVTGNCYTSAGAVCTVGI